MPTAASSPARPHDSGDGEMSGAQLVKDRLLGIADVTTHASA
jgi:hypothetical protein